MLVTCSLASPDILMGDIKVVAWGVRDEQWGSAEARGHQAEVRFPSVTRTFHDAPGSLLVSPHRQWPKPLTCATGISLTDEPYNAIYQWVKNGQTSIGRLWCLPLLISPPSSHPWTLVA
jgi:hypothetical protein